MIKVKDFDGREFNWNLNKVVRQDTPKSSHHAKALEIIAKICPSAPCYNEVTLLGCKGVGGVVLCADIFLPNIRLIIEVHGKQHYEYTPFFHKSKAGYYNYCRNDGIKKKWCEINNIKYLELKYNEQDKWEDLIYDSIVG